MTAQKMARCKRALERLHRDIANYSQGRCTTQWQASLDGLSPDERKAWFASKLHKAELCVAALNAKHIN